MARTGATRASRARIFAVLNPFMRLALRLPVRQIQDRLLLLSVIGRKSGRRFTVPLSYVVDSDGSLLIPGGGAWKLNLIPDRPVDIRLWGKRRLAIPELISDPGNLERLLPRLYRGNPRAESFVGVPLGTDGSPDRDKFAQVVREGFVIVRLRVDPTMPIDPATATRPYDAAVPGSRLAAVLMTWLVASAVVGTATFVIGSLLMPGSADTTMALTAVTVFGVYTVLIGSLFLFLGRDGGLRGVLRLRYTSVGDLALALAVGVLCWGVIVIAYGAVGSLGSLVDALLWIGSDGGRLGSLEPTTAALSVMRASLLAPIAEELLFRGALFGWLRGRSGAWYAIVVTAVLFGAIHILPILMPIGFVFGIGLGWVRERTGSTLPGVVFHVANNVLLVAAAYALTGWQ